MSVAPPGSHGVHQAIPPVRITGYPAGRGVSGIRLSSGSRIRLGQDGMQRAARGRSIRSVHPGYLVETLGVRLLSGRAGYVVYSGTVETALANRLNARRAVMVGDRPLSIHLGIPPDQIQGLALARACGFKSRLRHQ
jgi:hypothetical protein